MGEETNAHGWKPGEGLSGSFSHTGVFGEKFSTNAAVTLLKVTKHASDTATRCRIYDSGNPVSGNLLATASYVGDDATFSLALSNATSYYAVNDNSGSSWDVRNRGASPTYPFNGVHINFTTAWGQTTDDSSIVYSIISITTTDVAAGTNMQINVGDAWKEVSAMKINIGDAWKEVASASINIGDSWKSIF